MKKHLAAKNYSRCNFSWKKEASRKSAMKFRSRIFLQKRVQKKGERERGRKGKYSFRIKNQFPFLSLCRFYAPTHVPLLSRQDFIHSSYDVPSPLSIIRFHPLSPCYLPRQTSRDILSPRSFEPRHEYRRTTSVLEKPENRKAIEKKGDETAITIDSLLSRVNSVALVFQNLDLRRRSSRTTFRSCPAQKRRGVCRWYLDGRPTSDEKFPTGAADA